MDKAKQQGQFFTFPANAASEIIAAGGAAEEILALLILFRGAGMFTSSKWTENAIAKHGGFTYGRACKATSFLCAHGFIKAKSVAPTGETDKAESSNKWRIVRPKDKLIYLPNSLVDGIAGGKDNPPLYRLYKGIETALAQGIDTIKARLDAIVVLLGFYRGQDIAQYGGVNPRLWSRPWDLIENDDYIDAETPIDGSDGVFCEVERGDAITFKEELLDLLGYIQDPEIRFRRYWHAVGNIKRLSLAYEVIQIWNKDPAKHDTAEVMYPLYIFDQRARDSEPCIYREINSLAIDRAGAERFFDADGSSEFGQTINTFRFIAIKGSGLVACSVLRLRYRPHDRDTGLGMDEQDKKAQEWKKAAKQLRGWSGGFD